MVSIVDIRKREIEPLTAYSSIVSKHSIKKDRNFSIMMNDHLHDFLSDKVALIVNKIFA